MICWLATTESGEKEHAADYMITGEGAFPDDHESEIASTLCGIANPNIYMILWNPKSKNACLKCKNILKIKKEKNDKISMPLL